MRLTIRTLKSRISVFIAGSLFVLLSAALVNAQAPAGRALAAERFDITIRNKDFQDSLSKLSRTYDVPIGFEMSRNDETPSCHVRVDTVIKDASIHQIMQSLISHCPTYSWSISGATVNVYPSTKTRTILDHVIPNMIIEQKTSRDIVSDLFERKDVRAELTASGLTRDTTTPFWDHGSEHDPKLSTVFNDVPIRNIMNYLITHSEQRGWIYYKLSKYPERFSLGFF